VLERLTIFLAEARRKQSDYSAEWLSKEGNFELLEVRDLKARYTYRNGRHEYHHTEVGNVHVLQLPCRKLSGRRYMRRRQLGPGAKRSC
jgi:hypothetical protein